MRLDFDPSPASDRVGPPLRAYLLGAVDFGAALTLQHALAYQVAGDRSGGALVLCEHPPLITVGRHGGPGDVRFDADELETRGLRVRWVNRGGGTLLHLPGQLAAYPVLPLDALGLGLERYLARLHQVVLDLLEDFGIQGEVRPGEPGVCVAGRLIAAVGVAVRDWVSYYGLVLNVDPDLTPFRRVRTRPGDGPMTSLARERRGPPRPAMVRQRFLEHFAAAFGFGRTDLFFHHPMLARAGRPAHQPA